jgi:two-component system, OmpR family, phosphate regulon sensor histidine kinase PhoR
MPLEPSPSPVASTRVQRPIVRRPLEAAWAGAAGVGAILLLAMAGDAAPAPSAFAALAVGAASWLLARRALHAERAPAAQPLSESAGWSGRAADAGLAPPFEVAFERLQDPLLIVSAQEPDDLIARRVAYANAAAREMMRIPREGALLVNALRHPEVLEAVDESLFGGLTQIAEYETGGAQSRCWRAWSAPLDPAFDGSRLAVLLLRDETDVRRSQRMSADFLANASHELRTPLASLSGFIETLRGHAKDDPAARERFLGIMAAQAERMARLVDDLLSLSRIEMNEHVPPAGAVDLALIARDVLDALAPQAKARDVLVSIAGPAVAPVEGERDQLVQVVQNLLDNAIKYSPAGKEVTIEITAGLTSAEAGEGRRLGAARLPLLTPDRSERRYGRIRVTDAGPGIPREHLPRLTERFYRVEGQKSGDRAGTGLGLAIVKHVVNRHRGGLTVESLPGEGATFSVYLPEPAQR